jgi:two-component sensor histidine kinase
MSRNRNVLKITEVFLILFVWIVIIAAPLLFNMQDEYFDWKDAFKPIETLVPLFVIFMINRFVLVPILLFKNKRFWYVISVLGLIAVFTLGVFLVHAKANSRPGRPDLNRPAQRHLQNSPPDARGFGLNHPPPLKENHRPMPPFANLLIFSLLMIGFDTGLKASFRWAESEKEKAKLEKENVANQLAVLRNQISPHFFMNTLNNIHALIDLDKTQAQESVIQLSKLMRYLLSESQQKTAAIHDEFVFLKSYIELMRLRCSDKVDIQVDLDLDKSDVQVPPFLFVSLVENAFKYGVSYAKPSFIHASAKISDGFLYFQIKNSKDPEAISKQGTGVGLPNLRKQLDLLYGKNYNLAIKDDENEFNVNLKIHI